MRSNWKDFSQQVKIHRNKNVRLFLIIAGSFSLALGFIGIFLPILPTTPFLLLSAYCYARSSVRFYNLLLNNQIFGKYIVDWRSTGTIPLRTKVIALSALCLTIGSSVIFFIPLLPIKILVALIGVSVATYIYKIPTRS